MALYGTACHCIVSYGVAWYCIVGFGAGCISQDTYLLYDYDNDDEDTWPDQHFDIFFLSDPGVPGVRFMGPVVWNWVTFVQT